MCPVYCLLGMTLAPLQVLLLVVVELPVMVCNGMPWEPRISMNRDWSMPWKMRRLGKMHWDRHGGNRVIAIGILMMEILGCTMEVLARMIVWRNIERWLWEWSRSRSKSKYRRKRRRKIVG